MPTVSPGRSVSFNTPQKIPANIPEANLNQYILSNGSKSTKEHASNMNDYLIPVFH